MPKSRGTSSWYNAPAKRPEVPLSAVFFLFFSHFDIKAGKSPEDIVDIVMSLSNCRRVLCTIHSL